MYIYMYIYRYISASSVVPFKIHYASDMESVGIGRALRNHSWLLHDGLRCDISLFQCFLSQPNMFRLRFNGFLTVQSQVFGMEGS